MTATKTPRPVMLVVLDGWGWREETADNAVRLARTPNFSRLWETCPHTLLRASGTDVGLPKGQMGNSEVGHLNLGAGRIVLQDLPRIDAAIADGSLARNPVLLALIEALRRSGGACHLLGLLSPGGVHSHQDHALALARLLAQAGIAVRIHAFTDGRDTPPRSALDDMRAFLQALPSGVEIATVSGRYYAMDRDRRWDRVKRAYAAIAEADAPQFATPLAAIEAAYAENLSDEFIPPRVIGPYHGMQNGDGLLCFNFRADRVRELLGALLDPAFDGFSRARPLQFAAAAGMAFYSDELAPYLGVLFPQQRMAHILGEEISAAGKRQLRIAETEKYAHVTYFFNGGQETPFPGEDRILVPSPKVATYDLQPEMSAPEVTRRVVAAIAADTYDFIVLNYANPDMVGHTGSLSAAIRAVEAVDHGLGQVVQALAEKRGVMFLTADHGNCELMRDPLTGGPHTAHTTNPVPAILYGMPEAHLRPGRLADVAPTLLSIMGLPKPEEMTGESLLT
jgi:2,3-bisphosphoglycerate-independent phosphoglycerate mutase